MVVISEVPFFFDQIGQFRECQEPLWVRSQQCHADKCIVHRMLLAEVLVVWTLEGQACVLVRGYPLAHMCEC